MIRLAVLASLCMIWAAVGAAQPASQRGRQAPAPVAEPCDLIGQPGACTSCPSLLAALRLPGAPVSDNGLAAESVAWSPLFVAFRLDCRDAGRLLIARGANPERGGKSGALLVEIAAQHFVSPYQQPATTQAAAAEWIALLAKPRPFDLDAPISDGWPSTRAAWAATGVPQGTAAGSALLWSRIEALSANYPVLVEGTERVSVDLPAPDTGLTRPSETATSRGVQALLAAYDKGGMAGASIRVETCWAEQRAAGLPQAKWRWHLDNCAAMDVAAAEIDAGVASQLNMPRVPFFTDDRVMARLSAFEAFRTDGLAFAPYINALKRSVGVWMPIQFAIRTKGQY